VVQNLLIDVNDLVQLGNSQHIKVLVEEEKFHLMEVHWAFDTIHQDVYHIFIEIDRWRNVEWVNDESDLERVCFDADDEQLNELSVSYFIFLGLLELLVVVFFAIHLEHDINVLSRD
jgi:hypothetical protein